MRERQEEHMRLHTKLWPALLCVLFAGCATTGGLHTVPHVREYDSLKPVKVAEAAPVVERARRMGAAHYAPHDYFAALEFLDMARERKQRRDRRAMWDYANLARQHAEAAIKKCPADAAPEAAPRDAEAVGALFEKLKADYREYQPRSERVAEAAPYLYAQAKAALSRAEHEMLQENWETAGNALSAAAAAMNTIERQDTDKDGVPDIEDQAFLTPEDIDGYRDGDGVPDPDNDGDGVADVNDLDPASPETRNNWRDNDGLPDQTPELEAVVFDPGSASLSSEARGYLQGVAIVLREWPDLELAVAGHSDATHSPQYNMEIAQRRAQQVQEELVRHGAAPSQIVVTFYGAPPEGVDAAGAANRVELELR
jgi:outer membrane protein OmpA-like peptidoglycan-associated protein